MSYYNCTVVLMVQEGRGDNIIDGIAKKKHWKSSADSFLNDLVLKCNNLIRNYTWIGKGFEQY